MKTRAAVLMKSHLTKPYATSKPIEIMDVDLEPPGESEVLVKISAAGVCHSDLSVVNGTRVRHLPVVLGHEASGVVEEIGASVKNFKHGDRVVFAFLPSCGNCVECLSGQPSNCAPGHAANAAGTLLNGANAFC
jgi:alcohol dehydrogenase